MRQISIFLLLLLCHPSAFSMTCDEAEQAVGETMNSCNSNWDNSCQFENAQGDNITSDYAKYVECFPHMQGLLPQQLIFAEANHLTNSPTPSNIQRLKFLNIFAKSPEIGAFITKHETNNTKANCKAQDYRSKLPPIRNQDSLGVCYGFTAADLLSFKTGQNISAMDLSLSYHKSDITKSYINDYIQNRFPLSRLASQIEGGQIGPTLKGALAQGACLEKDFPSDDYRSSVTGDELQKILQRIESYSTRMQGNTCTDCPSESEVVQSTQLIAPNVSREDALRAVRTHGPERIIAELGKLTCKSRVPLPPANVVRAPNTIANVQEQLNSGNIAGIEYGMNVLYGLGNGGVNHASSIVGQKWNEETQQCEFLLRNSFGNSCEYLPYKCEPDGHIWIPAKTIMGATTGAITYIN